MVAEVSKKPGVRAELRPARRSMPPADRSAADAVVVQALVDLVLAERARLIAAYVPLAGEPGGPDLVAALAAAVPRLLLPVLRDDLDLDWALFDDRLGAGRFGAGRFGLLEPAGARLGRDAIEAAELGIVPALAVDRSGVRLGQGGGSYDRVLRRVRAPTISPLYPGELLDSLPAEPHDQRVAMALVGYETAHLYWTKAAPIPHHWHSKYLSANDGG